MITSVESTRNEFGTVGTPSALARLVASLAQLDLTTVASLEVERLLRASDIDAAALRPFAYFLPGRYTRVCVYRGERFEVLVLCWSPGSASPIHNHGRSRCFLKLASGSLNVENYSIVEGGHARGPAQLALAQSLVMISGDIDVRNADTDVHRVGAADGAAMSIHVYAKPLDECLVYDLARGTCDTTQNRYDILPPR